MATKAERNKAIDFMVSLLEKNSNYRTLKVNAHPKVDAILVADEDRADPNFHVALIDRKISEKEFNSMLGNIMNQGSRVAPVFYKDGKTFAVPMVKTQAWREDKAFKKYSHEDIKSMIATRKLERAVAQVYNLADGIPYFSPEKACEPAMLEKIAFLPVQLNYDHLEDSFAQEGPSVTYKLPRITKFAVDRAIQVRPLQGLYARLDF